MQENWDSLIENQYLHEVEEGIHEYRLNMPGCSLSYEHGDYPRGAYWILLIVTDKECRGEGRATALLDYFFREIVSKNPGAVYPGAYTDAGALHILPVLEQLVEKYGIEIQS